MASNQKELVSRLAKRGGAMNRHERLRRDVLSTSMAKVNQLSHAHLYAISIIAFRHEDGDLVIAHCAAYITADSPEDAKLTAQMVSAPEAFPTSEGWFDHAVVEADIPDELIKVPLKAWSKLDCGPEREQ